MRILLVDDEEDIRKIGRLSLAAVGGFDVLLAATAAEGLALAASARPDVILLDMMMPEMDGLTALAALRADPALAAIPVIFVTAKVQPAEAAHYVAMGARGVVKKPFDPMTLPDEIRQILAAAEG